MHETSIAAGIISIVEDAVKREGLGRVLEVEVEVGLLSLVDIESLRFALEVMSRDTVLEGARITFKTVEPLLRCSKCGAEWGLDKTVIEGLDEASKMALHMYPEAVAQLFKCPRCGSAETEVVRGRDVRVSRLRVEEKGS